MLDNKKMTRDQGDPVASKVIDEQMIVLTKKLSAQLAKSPESGLANSKRKLLYLSEPESDESIASNASSYARKVKEKKKRKRKRELLSKKGNNTEIPKAKPSVNSDRVEGAMKTDLKL